MFIPLSYWDAVCQGSHANTCSRSRRIRTCTSNRRPKTLATPVSHSPCALALWRTPSSCIANVLFALLVLCEIPRCPLPCYRCSATVMILLSPSVVRLSRGLTFPFFWMSMQKDPPFSFQVLAGLVLALSVLRFLTRNCDPSAREQSTRQHLTGYTSFASSDRIDMSAC